MSIHVTGLPRVNVRCEFKTIPGVTHITMEFSPYSRGNLVTGKIDSPYGEFSLDDQDINNCLLRRQLECLSIFKKDTFEEIAKAVEDGFNVLRSMVKVSGYVASPF